jgi:lipopolysaccharide/colanic/teichoic acid biosynthesis glycosyltransferase
MKIIMVNRQNSLLTYKKSFLPRAHFFDHLRAEKKRAERSKGPLSIVLFYLVGDSLKRPEAVEEFLDFLDENTRETDTKGWLDVYTMAIILPNTDRKGLNYFVQKILRGNGFVKVSITMGTYPDDIFKKLLAEAEIKSEFSPVDLFPLDLDEPPKPRWIQDLLKRGIDVVGSLLGLILFFPLMFVIGLAVKIDSPGPIFFRQMRVGRKGLQFLFLKFRSMYWNVDDRIHRDYVTDLIGGNLEKINQGEAENPFFKMKSDSRVTRVGKIIRGLSLDELPQFYNVLKGDMSLVGPRPPIPYEIEKYGSWHLRRILEVRPGITGLWQVSGRSKLNFDQMVRLDLRYVNNWTLWLDLKILLKTIWVVFYRKSAA